MTLAAPPRGANPFDPSGVQPDENGIRRYSKLHHSIVGMLRDSVPLAADLDQSLGPRIGVLPRNPNGKVLKAQLRQTDFGAPLFP